MANLAALSLSKGWKTARPGCAGCKASAGLAILVYARPVATKQTV